MSATKLHELALTTVDQQFDPEQLGPSQIRLDSAVMSLESPKRLKPPFGYYGAKHRVASQIVQLLPPHNAWVEAFCGSSAVTLAKAPAQLEVINDLDHEIVNLFRQIRDNWAELARLIALTPYSTEEFHLARANSADLSPVERARRFLVLTMMTVNGSVGSPEKSGFSFSHSFSRLGKEARVSRWYNLPDRIAEIVDRLRTVRIESKNALELLEDFCDRPATLLYLDPPYLTQRSHNYRHDANEFEFHSRLIDSCEKSKAMIVLSGYESELYSLRLTPSNGWRTVNISAQTKGTSGKQFGRVERVWLNAAAFEAREMGKVPIELTETEQKERKINPIR